MQKIKAIRGMNDVLPQEALRWQYLEQISASLLARWGYQELRFPVLENTALFKRSIGEVTDIVEKEMYTFEDRNGDSLTLRPEGTACAVRAAEEHGLLYNQTHKLWYRGPMYRHERPQKGRYRQFHQLGVECFGYSGVDIELELIQFCQRLWQELSLNDHITLQINTLGAAKDRAEFGKALHAYLMPVKDQLDEDSKRRMDSNVLRILDSKDPSTQHLLQAAPVMGDFVNPRDQAQFDELKASLHELGIAYIVNPALVRGLDYYNGLVFEFVTDKLGAQATVCAGGRYDQLAVKMGATATPAVGFAMGLERLLLLMQEVDVFPEALQRTADVYVAVVGGSSNRRVLALVEKWRDKLPNLRFLTHCGGGKYNSQMKKAFTAGARAAVIFDVDGTQEEVRVRLLEGIADTKTISVEKVVTWLLENLQ